jgi:trimethylamine-N-oxide reductase (cytochrome c)
LKKERYLMSEQVLTNCIKAGIVHGYASSAKYDPLEPGKPNSIDRGGCCLIEIAKWEG